MLKRNGLTGSAALQGRVAAPVLSLLLLLAGCTGMEKPEPPVVIEIQPPQAEGTADADDDGISPPPLVTPLLTQTTRPLYTLNIPASPKALGNLDVPLARKWRHIVIHHSYTKAGNEAAFDRYHREVRGWQGVGYHFVIGNGNGSADGAIEVTFRWEKQIQGAHAGVEEYNQHGIGICLVGDFSKGYPTERQMASLVSLVNYLQRRCRMPTSHVMLHRHVKNTECPGKNFPFYKFISLLEH